MSPPSPVFSAARSVLSGLHHHTIFYPVALPLCHLHVGSYVSFHCLYMGKRALSPPPPSGALHFVLPASSALIQSRQRGGDLGFRAIWFVFLFPLHSDVVHAIRVCTILSFSLHLVRSMFFVVFWIHFRIPIPMCAFCSPLTSSTSWMARHRPPPLGVARCTARRARSGSCVSRFVFVRVSPCS